MFEETDTSAPRVFILAFRISPNDARYLKLRRSFISAGFVVAAAAPGIEGTSTHGSVQVIPVGARPRSPIGAWAWSRRLANGLAKAGQAFRPDVIYVFDPEALPAALQLKRRSGAALVYDAHEFHEEEDPSDPARGRWAKKTELLAAPQLSGFVTVNASIAQLYLDERPGIPKPIVVHNAIDPLPATPYDGRLHRAANLSPDAPIMLFQGAMTQMRGLDRLVAAVSLFEIPLSLVMMGSGPLRAGLEAAANRERVRFLDPVPHDELQDWTCGATLGAILYEDSGRSQHFCSPNKLWEYAAAGVPALASDLPEIARVVQAEGTGFLLPSDASAEDIARVIEGLDPGRLAAAKTRALDFAQRETWETEVAPLICAVRELAAQRS